MQMMQPGVTRAESQRYGCTRLLMQLTRVKMELAAADRKRAAAEEQLEAVRKEVKVLNTWYDSQEAKDVRLLEYRLLERVLALKS